jgi:hypothetical protein
MNRHAASSVRRLLLPIGGRSVAVAAMLVSFPASAADPPPPSSCDEQTKSEIHRLYKVLASATEANFDAAYSEFSLSWELAKNHCEEKPLLEQTDQLDPTDVALRTLVAAAEDIEILNVRLKRTVDEAGINTVSSAAQKSIDLGTVAYGAMRKERRWSNFVCPADTTQSTVPVRSGTGAVLAVAKVVSLSKLPKDLVGVAKEHHPEELEFSTLGYYCRADRGYQSLKQTASKRRGAVRSLCGGYSDDGQFRTPCLVYGVLSSSVGYSWILDPGLKGTGRLPTLAAAVPYGAVRFILGEGEFWRFVALDLAVYSAFLSTNPSLLVKPSPNCATQDNGLTRALHCETNPAVRTFAGFSAGLTVGQSNVGYLTLAPISIGFAQIGDQGIRPVFGMYASALQITGKF